MTGLLHINPIHNAEIFLMNHIVRYGKTAGKLTQSLPLETYLDFDRTLDRLRQDGCLTEEIPLGDRLFAFEIEGDWVAIAQRQEHRTFWGQRKLRITVAELMPVDEFGRWMLENAAQSPSLPSADTTPEPTASRLMGMLVKAIGLCPNPLLVWVAIPIALTAIALKYPGTVDIQIKTDGDRNVAGEVTIDGRQSE
jgi:hypothetical protein